MKSNFGVRRPDEVQAAQGAPPPRKGIHGRKPKRHPAPLDRVEEAIAGLPLEAWQTITWREGSKGPMQDGAGGEKNGADGETTTSATCRQRRRSRSWRQLCVRGGRLSSSTKMANNSTDSATSADRIRSVGRRWDGLHRHIALVMLSYSYLALTRWKAATTILPTLPEVHRRVLLALLVDLVQQWAQTAWSSLAVAERDLSDRAPPGGSHSLTK